MRLSHPCQYLSDVSECSFVLQMQLHHFSVWSIVSKVSIGCAIILINAFLLSLSVQHSDQYLSCRNLQKKIKQSEKQDSGPLLSLAHRKELLSRLLKGVSLRILLRFDN